MNTTPNVSPTAARPTRARGGLRLNVTAKPIRNVLLGRLHQLAHQRAWDDDEYRDILQGITGKRSGADCTNDELLHAIAVFQSASGVASAQQAHDDPTWRALIDHAIAEKRPLLRKIAALCTDLGKGKPYAEGIATRQSGGTARRLEMMNGRELWELVAALMRTQKSRDARAARQTGARK